MARTTRQFSDINLLFSINPATADLTKKFDEEAVKASVRNLISTRNYERPFHPEIGCQIFSLLFENFTPVTTQIMKKTIFQVIEKFEPRVVVDDVVIRETPDQNSIAVDVYFRIVNSEKPITVTTALSRIR
jgi:phage baseplate assembly protein W